MFFIKDMFIDIEGIRKITYEVDDYCEYMVITYAFDEEHPTKIMVEDHADYLDAANRICAKIDRISDYGA